MLLSGGADGCVRCWSGRTQETLADFSEHTRAVSSVLFDNSDSRLAHSCALDRTIATYDLAEEKKLSTHITADEAFTALCQRSDGEKELVSGAVNGMLSVWDCDVPDSVCSIHTGSAPIRSLAISPSGNIIAVANEDGDVMLYGLGICLYVYIYKKKKEKKCD